MLWTQIYENYQCLQLNSKTNIMQLRNTFQWKKPYQPWYEEISNYMKIPKVQKNLSKNLLFMCFKEKARNKQIINVCIKMVKLIRCSYWLTSSEQNPINLGTKRLQILWRFEKCKKGPTKYLFIKCYEDKSREKQIINVCYKVVKPIHCSYRLSSSEQNTIDMGIKGLLILCIQSKKILLKIGTYQNPQG